MFAMRSACSRSVARDVTPPISAHSSRKRLYSSMLALVSASLSVYEPCSVATDRGPVTQYFCSLAIWPVRSLSAVSDPTTIPSGVMNTPISVATRSEIIRRTLSLRLVHRPVLHLLEHVVLAPWIEHVLVTFAHAAGPRRTRA